MKNILKAYMNWKILLGIGAIILLAYTFVPQIANYSWILLALLCPLSMMFMMAGMNHGDSTSKKVFVCPECSMSYEDAEWAKKCAAWCKEYKSCNLEITEHSIKTSL